MSKIFENGNYRFTLGGTLLKFNGGFYTFPTEEKLLELGFTEVVVETPVASTTTTKYTPPTIPIEVKYSNLVNSKIRKQYTASESEGILRKAIAAGGTTDEFTEFNAYCEQCKTEAKEELGMTETAEITTEDEITE